jgi:hypothetical protein
MDTLSPKTPNPITGDLEILFSDYRQLSGVKYPPFSLEPFESYFYKFFILNEHYVKLKDRFIPIFWTESYIKNSKIPILDEKLSTLKNDNYFTIIQHDDGIKNNIPKYTRIYSMGSENGKLKYYKNYIPIPLTYFNPELFSKYSSNKKDIFISFIGSLTHIIRKITYNSLVKKPGVFLKLTKWSNKIDISNQNLFIEITSRSTFTLAPRGYGITSFRLYEALNLGSIPVYISDKFWLPFQDKVDWNKLAILCPISQISTLYLRLRSISNEQIQNMLTYYKSVSYLFTYEGIANYILEKELSF